MLRVKKQPGRVNRRLPRKRASLRKRAGRASDATRVDGLGESGWEDTLPRAVREPSRYIFMYVTGRVLR